MVKKMFNDKELQAALIHAMLKDEDETVRTHAMQGAVTELHSLGLPETEVEQIMLAMDMRIRFFGNTVPEPVMYLILGGVTAVLILVVTGLTAQFLIRMRERRKNGGENS